HTTLNGGKVVASEGRSLVEPNPISLPAEIKDSFRLRPDISAQQFKIPCASTFAKIRVMELVNQTITAERMIGVSASGGFIGADLSADLLKVAVFERHSKDTQIALGLVNGFGTKLGAVGTTTNLDENTLMVVGANDEDMALCANALLECGGGMAVVHRGTVLDKISFPYGGIFSIRPRGEIADGLRRVQGCLQQGGSAFEKPMYVLSFLTFVTLPALRITARGLVNVKERKIVPLFAD
ncbi:MAG TPA: adenine deaminase C-terminal domain-containing protein, partial [Candidatus Binatia bacterium]|nr:adenine deaminase C-terminal domain-containing protein [Candidatus Binatia bacterium]